MAKVYLALYKGRKTIKTPKDLAFRIIEWVIRKVTGGQYPAHDRQHKHHSIHRPTR